MTTKNYVIVDSVTDDIVEKIDAIDKKIVEVHVLNEELLPDVLRILNDNRNHWMSERDIELKNKSVFATVFKAINVQVYKQDGINVNNVFKETLVKFNGEFYAARTMFREKTALFCILGDNREYHMRMPNYRIKCPAPQKVGAITDKKMKAWADWLETRKNNYDELVNGQNLKVAKFLERVRKFDSIHHSKDNRIGEDCGYLYLNNLEFSYSILNGYIDQRIKIRFQGYYPPRENVDTLDMFTEMTEGKCQR